MSEGSFHLPMPVVGVTPVVGVLAGIVEGGPSYAFGKPALLMQPDILITTMAP
jgi:hypothetical protein